MSIFSPRSSCTTACTRLPFMPTQAPTGSTSESREETAILARPPGSRAAASITTTPSAISGTSISKSLAEQLHRGAGEDDLRTLRLAEHVEHVGLDAVAGAVALARHLLAHRQHRLGAPQVDDHVAALEAPDDAGDDLALAVLVLVEDVLALGVAGALDHHLLGGLRGDAAERAPEGLELQQVAPLVVLRLRLRLVLGPIVDGEVELVAHLHLDTLLVGDRHRDHVDRVGERALLGGVLHDGEHLEEVDAALVVVEVRLEVPLDPEMLLGGHGDGLLQDGDQRRALDALVLGHLVEDEVQVHGGGGRHVSSSS